MQESSDARLGGYKDPLMGNHNLSFTELLQEVIFSTNFLYLISFASRTSKAYASFYCIIDSYLWRDTTNVMYFFTVAT